jgi:hypothetical protein
MDPEAINRRPVGLGNGMAAQQRAPLGLQEIHRIFRNRWWIQVATTACRQQTAMQALAQIQAQRPERDPPYFFRAGRRRD